MIFAIVENEYTQLSYIEDQLDENGELPDFDPEAVDENVIKGLTSNIMQSLDDIFSGRAKYETREKVIDLGNRKTMTMVYGVRVKD